MDPTLKAQVVSPATNKGSTSMAFIGPNDILVLEKSTGKVKRIVNGSVLSKPVLILLLQTRLKEVYLELL